jgi:hypothetical protein
MSAINPGASFIFICWGCDELEQYNERRCTVTDRPAEVSEAGEPMHWVRFTDGFEARVFPDELCTAA